MIILSVDASVSKLMITSHVHVSGGLQLCIGQHSWGGGAHPKKNSRYTKIGKLALVFFGFFFNFQIGIGFFCFFLVFFFGFFWHWFWPEFEIGNWFFWFFFGIGLGQHSKLETGFLGSVGFFWFFWLFFWDFLVFLVSKFRVRISSQKIPKKNQSLHQNW